MSHTAMTQRWMGWLGQNSPSPHSVSANTPWAANASTAGVCAPSAGDVPEAGCVPDGDRLVGRDRRCLVRSVPVCVGGDHAQVVVLVGFGGGVDGTVGVFYGCPGAAVRGFLP